MLNTGENSVNVSSHASSVLCMIPADDISGVYITKTSAYGVLFPYYLLRLRTIFSSWTTEAHEH